MVQSPTIESAARHARPRHLDSAQAHMRAQHWSQAAEDFLELDERAPGEEFQLNICRNLAALQQHRPEVYQIILSAAEPERYVVGAAACGHPTIFYRTDNGSRLCLSPGNQPVAGLSMIFAKIKQQYQAGQAMGIHGIGDGYLLKSCALNPPKMLFDAEHSVYLFEPDVQAVTACMTIHDYTGPRGPIEQRRFRWFIGRDYIAAARECLLGEMFNPPPLFDLCQSPHAAAISAVKRSILDELHSKYRALQSGVRAHYEAVTARHLAELFSTNPPRRPRALLITTRLSSVLQYSTRDTAEGLRSAGWDARVFVEPAAHQVATGTKLAEMLCDFKPDLVFQIDHLRHEWQETLPPQLPFVCWIQDHMPNLTSAAAGARITHRDFLLCGMPRMYTDRYGYPPRQFMQMPKLTLVPQRPISWKSDGDDLVYVSSASAVPTERAREIVEAEDPQSPLRAILIEACDRLIAHYESGGTVTMIGGVEPMLAAAEKAAGVAIADPEMRRRCAEKLFDRLNNPLYRQQALGWAQSIAAKHGLQFAIYGPGWNHNPRFAAHARGPIQYGPPLEALSRASKINLVLEPTLNISHQRLLDALAAGGFCLIRHHPANTLFQGFLNFLTAYAPLATTVDEAQDTVKGEGVIGLRSWLDQFADYAVMGDPVAHVRELRDSKILLDRSDALPDLSAVSFDNEAEMETRVLGFLADEGRRRETAARQREEIEGRFSYIVGMKRVVGWIGRLLVEEGR